MTGAHSTQRLIAPANSQDYSWCSQDLNEVAFEQAGGADRIDRQRPIPPLLGEDLDPELPFVGEHTAGGDERLELVRDRRIRALSAYWHNGWPYSQPEALLRNGAAERLSHAAHALPADFGLAIWDAWRDPRLQAELHRVAYSNPNLAPGFVNPPSSDPRTPPPHATGGAIDVTLTWRGMPLSLGTEFDAFVDLAHARSLESVTDGTKVGTERDLRRLLRAAMVGAGFVQLACEWWHFEYGTRLWAAVHETEPMYPAAALTQAGDLSS